MSSLSAPEPPTNLPGRLEANSSLHQPQHNLGRGPCRVGKSSIGSLQDASLQAQELAVSLPDLDGIAPALATGKESLSEQIPLKHLAFEEGTRQKLQEQVPPPTQLRHMMLQLRDAIVTLHQVVHSLEAELAKDEDEKKQNNNQNNSNNTTNNNNHTANNNNNNNNNNNDNDNNKRSRESGLNSLDLDNDNPESEPDLDETSLVSFNPAMGVESSSRNLDQQEADLSLDNLSQMMTIGLSLGSLDQKNGQEGLTIGTAWEPSLEQTNESFDRPKPKKRVTFSKAALAAYNKRRQNNRQQQNESSQLEQLEHNNKMNNKASLEDELPKENNKSTTTQTCWNELQQEQKMQQQPATASEKNLEHKRCIDNSSLDSEDESLGSLESETQATMAPACRSPKHNNNISSLGLGTKNKAAYGILIDTGAAISLAPMSFAPTIELSPVESTLQLRTVTGKAIEAFGRKTVQLVGSELSLNVSFVIADVEHALIGMDILMAEQLSMIRSSFNEYYLVNTAGAKTKLQPRGHHLYIEACPDEFGLSTCKGSSLPEENGSLLDDKDGTQEGAALSSGGACETSFFPEELRHQQDKNTAALGTTALPAKGARRRKRKKPSAKKASQDHDQRSLEQKGQKPAATQPRNLEKTSIIKEIELAAGEEQTSLSNLERHELSLRILLTLSLRNKWLITTTRATTDCSEEALGKQLRNIGLDQNKMDQNIFSGDELVILVHKSNILIGGTDLQQECLFCELSALISLDQLTKLDQDTQVSFCNRILEYKASSNSISLSLTTSFYMELLQRHELEDAEATTTLEEEKLSQDASKQDNTALDADRQELYQRTVGDLVWAATACRPDLSFEVHLLTQSLTTPTKGQEQQLRKVLRYIKGTLHYTLSLQPTNRRAKEKAQSLELVAFSASSWTEAGRPTSTAYLTLWGVSLTASCKTSCAYKQADAELDGVRLALGLACHTKSLLQHLGLDQLDQLVDISLKTSSWHDELVTGRPLAMQLGLSRRNKHIKLRSENGQLQLSKVHLQKNLAHSLTNTASGSKRMLAKLRVATEAAGTVALSTVRGQDVASLGVSSSFLVGMVAAKPSQMEKPQLRKPSCFKSVSFVRTCLESLSRNFADKSVTSLILHSLSLHRSNFESLTLTSWSLPIDSLPLHSLNRPEDRFHSLTLHSLSVTRDSLTLPSLSSIGDRSSSLTLQSLSLINENRFQRISFKEVSFEDGSLEETADILEHSLAEGGAETNSFSNIRFQERMLGQEAETNSFFTQSFSERILSLRMCLRIFLLSSFQLTCAALLLGTCSFAMSFPNESLQSEELVAAYSRSSFPQQSLQQDELERAYFQSPTRASQLDSLEQKKLCSMSLDNLSEQLCSTPLYRSTLASFNQLDLEISLSLTWLGSTRCRTQLQANTLARSRFEHRALPCAALAIASDTQDQEQISSELSASNAAALLSFDSRGSST